jgi:hypothetical protein
MFRILILFLMFSCSKSQTSLSRIKSADITSCVDNATLGLKEKFGADYSCFTTDFSTYVDGVNLSAQCESIIAQCESISQSTQISQNTSMPLSNISQNSGSDMFDNLGTPITANNPVAPEYDALNQNQLTNPNSVDQNSLNSFNNSITDPVFSFGEPIRDSNLNFLDPFTPGVSSPATANEPFSDLIGPLSTNYKYDSNNVSSG